MHTKIEIRMTASELEEILQDHLQQQLGECKISHIIIRTSEHSICLDSTSEIVVIGITGKPECT